MSIRLSDIQAQAWVWRTGVPGKPPVSMKPLSLATFAAAELAGCGLDALLNPDLEAATEAWIVLYAFLRGEDPELVAREVGVNRAAFAAFIEHVKASIESPVQEEQVRTSHRRSKDPRTHIVSPDGTTMEAREGTNYAVLFDLVRYTRVSLDDLYRMTYRGLMALSSHLEDNPPAPSLFGE